MSAPNNSYSSFQRARNTCLVVVSLHLAAVAAAEAQQPPYPQSHVIAGVEWQWITRQQSAIGSDLWPVTWGPDDNLYVAWGDGGGFGGTDSDGRVSMGFARIEGGPENLNGININGGKNPEHPASFLKKGKTAALLFDQGILYASINLQDGKWPDVNHVLAWSTNKGATWKKCNWLFPKGADNFQPARFLNFGKDGAGVPASLEGYVYLFGGKQNSPRNVGDSLYLTRVPRDKVREREAYQFFSGLEANGRATWNAEFGLAQAIFTDTNGVAAGGMVFDPGLGRYLLTTFHTGPGQLGIFEAEQPWGPWSTIAYYESWAKMGTVGEGLTCEFPQKWMSADGMTFWAIFSAYGEGAKAGINTHDRFNLMELTLTPAKTNTVPSTAPPH